jgi:hypothetical protein
MSLAATQTDGATLRDHLLAAGSTDPRLTAYPPRGTESLWHIVVALAAQRSEPVATPLSEIDAWQRLHGVTLSPWEVETVQAADRACAAALRSQSENKRRVK